MYGDTGAAARESFSGVILPASSSDDAAPWLHGAKALVWVILAAGSWAAVILGGYFLGSAF